MRPIDIAATNVLECGLGAAPERLVARAERDSHRSLTVAARLTGAALLAAALSLSGCSQLTGGGPATIWIVPGEAELNTDTPAQLENDIYSASQRELRLSAALNETIAFQIGLASAAPPAGPFDVRIEDFTGPGGVLKSAEIATIYKAHYTRVTEYRSWYPRHVGKPAVPTLFPDVLVPWDAPRGGGPVRVDENRNEVVWVDLTTPTTVEPGLYAGRIEVRRAGGGEVAFVCNVRLTILPIAVPNRRALPVVARVDPRDLLKAHVGWQRSAAEPLQLLPTEPSHAGAIGVVNATMRLLQSHRLNPVLWAAFPKHRLAGERSVEIDWEDYDALVAGWLDGSSFVDRVPLDYWPLPATLEHPSAEKNDGVMSPAYARLLGAYLEACADHFAEREWAARGFFRPAAPGPLSTGAVEQIKQLAEIARAAKSAPPTRARPIAAASEQDQDAAPTDSAATETENADNTEPSRPIAAAGARSIPLIAHLPGRSLRGLGWHNAPTAELGEVAIWAPPANWFEPAVMTRQRLNQQQTWFVPGTPPYSPSLAIEAPATDAVLLPWQAYRYGAEGIWLEHAGRNPVGGAERDRAAGPVVALDEAGLVYPGEPFGLTDQPAPSRRLKRLRRGLQDVELLTLLARGGRAFLAKSLADQVIAWAFTDACISDLQTTRAAGWPVDASIPALARVLVLQELTGQTLETSIPPGEIAATDSTTRWGMLMNQAQRIRPEPEGVRLSVNENGFTAFVLTAVSNFTSRGVSTSWALSDLPEGWSASDAASQTVGPQARQANQIEITIPALSPREDGVHPFTARCEVEGGGMTPLAMRLAATSAPLIDTPPRIDGELDDWTITPTNTAGDFRLVAVADRPGAATVRDVPTLPTQAFFCQDGTTLYVAVRCALPEGERPRWESDNVVTVDGAIPWGQEVVEILIDPRVMLEGPASQIYALQIKPSGLVVARRGCRTDPPIGASEEWRCDATVAAAVGRGAWTVEVAIPLSALGRDALRNRVWGVNVTRLDARRGEYASWSGARGHCYRPAALGNLLIAGAE